MLTPTLLVFAFFNLFGSAWHVQYYSSYCYNITLTSTTAACVRGANGKGVMTKIYLQNVNLGDGSGSASSAYKAECCPIDSGVMPAGWSNPASKTTEFNAWEKNIDCPGGNFLHQIVISGNQDKTTDWNPIRCIQPSNLDANYEATTTVPLRGAFILLYRPPVIACPAGSYITGFLTTKRIALLGLNDSPGDLYDIEDIKCAYPRKESCPPISPPLDPQVVATTDNAECVGPGNMHQYCTQTLTCSSGYLPSPALTTSVYWAAPLSRMTLSPSVSGRTDPRFNSYPEPTLLSEVQAQNPEFHGQYTWQPANDAGSLIIDLGLPRAVVGLSTMGGCGDPMWRFCDNQWVSGYSYKYSNTTTFSMPVIGVAGNTNANTIAVNNVPNFVARYIWLNVTSYVVHALLRADVLVRPAFFFMIKEASFGLACAGSNLGNRLAAVSSACRDERQSCKFTVNPGAAGDQDCLNSADLRVEWFYNGVLQPAYTLANAAGQDATLVPVNFPQFTCQPSGVLVGPRITCVDMNECRRQCQVGETPGIAECNDCGANSYCDNTPGSFRCLCSPGYVRPSPQEACADVIECNRNCGGNDLPFRDKCNDCNLASTTCVNTIGNFTCPCKDGYTPIAGVSNQCKPIDECNITCTGSETHCNGCAFPSRCVEANSVLGYACSCPPGYTGNGFVCNDINECSSGNGGCPARSTCFNTNGSFTCNCTAGYTANAQGGCDDIDECQSNSTICEGPCVNTVGSYQCSPYISLVRWKLVGNPSFVAGPANLTSVLQTPADIVEITVENIAAPFVAGSAYFRYGSTEYPNDFRTDLCTIVGKVYTCLMQPGAGQNLRFSLEVCTSFCGWFRSTSFPFSYPPPTLTNGTLAVFGSAGTTNLTVTTQIGNVIVMNGTGFLPSTGPFPQMSVTFGNGLTCALEVVDASQLRCQMASFSGSGATFRVSVGRGSSVQWVRGSDTVSVMLTLATGQACGAFPTIVNVTGCNAGTAPGTTSGCSTPGGELIVVTTDVPLVLPVVVLVGGQPCLFQGISANNQSTSCILPGGVGNRVPVAVAHSTPSVFSLPFFAISYAPPSIVSISSAACESLNNFTLVKCVRNGMITITGNNFGDSGAMVFAGGKYYSATHDASFLGPSVHQHLQVAFPPFQPGTLQLMVFARSDVGSGPGSTYRFALCEAGTRTELNGSCTPCPPGFVTNSSGQLRCSPCGAGTAQRLAGQQGCEACTSGYYSSTGFPQCLSCNPGTFSGPQATSCTNCAPGNYSLSAATSCLTCVPGKAQPFTGRGACDDCPVGYFSNSSGQSACVACMPGSISVFEGLTKCDVCLPGSFQSNPGSSDCLPCGLGTFSNTTGALICLPCATGKAATELGMTECELCGPGTAQNQCGMGACAPCGPGRYSATYGLVECELCQPGRATNLTQQLRCQDCQAGEFQSEAGASSCQTCPRGEFSEFGQTLLCQKCKPGKAQAVTGQSGCTACEVGTFSAEEAQPACLSCPSGTYQTAEGQAQCVECPAGSFRNSTTSCYQCRIGTYSTGSADVCTVCPVGYYARPYDGESHCSACSPGRFSNVTASTSCAQCPPGSYADAAGSRGCQPCEAGRFSSTLATSCDKCAAGLYSAGSSLEDCLSCADGSTVDPKQTMCLCPAGQYASQTVTNGVTRYTCHTNPFGTVTDLGGIIESELVTRPGYWRSSNATLVYYRCPSPQFCLGGKASTCGNFREGPVCALCKPGYKSAGSSRECAACPAVVGTSWGITFAILIAVGLALIFAYWLILRMVDSQQQELLEKEKAKLDASVSSLNASTHVGDEYFAQLRAEIQSEQQLRETEMGTDSSVNMEESGVSSEEDSAMRRGEKANDNDIIITYGQRRAPNFMYKIKIMVGFYQVASFLPNQGGINWPQQFVDFIHFFSFLNFDFIPWQNLACAVTLDYYTKILIVGLLPIAMIVALAIFFSLSLFFYGRKDDLAGQFTKQNRVLRAKRQFTKLVLFTIFLLYPFVSRTALGVYNCVTIDGVRYLATDFTLLCGAPEWNVAAGYTAIFVALYPLGTPVIYYFLMSRVDRHSSDAFLELGFLYEAYVDDRWYWELLDMGHKLILTSIVVFMPNELIMGANMVIMVLYLILLLVCNPYLRKGDDRLHLLAQTNLFVLALMGHALRLLDDPFKAPFASRFTVEALLSALLISINVLFLTSFLIIAGRNIKKAYVQYVFRRKKLLAANSVEDPSQSWVRFSPPVASQSMAEG